MPTFTKKSWVPVLNGPVYCSPACGFGCRKEDHDQKHAMGGAIAYNLGRGWMVQMLETSDGWHVEVISPCRRVHVFPRLDRFRRGVIHGYSAHITEAGESGIEFMGDGKTPKAAIKKVLATADKHLAKIGASLTILKEAMRGTV